MNITANLTKMLTECTSSYGEWDQVLVDEYNAVQTSRGGITIQIGHTAEEALQIIKINSL